jgi:UPF0716 family protein affecting phage T7 exclusion
MFLVPGKFLFLLALAAEVVATFLVSEQLGFLGTLAWFFLAFVLGVVVIKRAGARAARKRSA